MKNKIMTCALSALCFNFNAQAAEITPDKINTFEDGLLSGWHRGELSGTPPKIVLENNNQYMKLFSFGPLEGQRDPDSKMAVFNSSFWAGDYNAQGIQSIKAQMINQGNTPLYMRLRIGDADMVTMYTSNDAIELPADGQWREVSFGMTSEYVTGIDFGGGGAPQAGTGAGVSEKTTARAKIIALDEIRANVGHMFFISAQDSLSPNKIQATLGVDNIRASTAAPAAPVVISAPTVDTGTPPPTTPPASQAIPSPRAVSGLWYDPSLDGSGFNLVYTEGGLLALYYGYSSGGQKLWLISNIVSEPLNFSTPIAFNMRQGGGNGTFDTPTPPGQLADWGTLQIQFDQTCLTGIGTGQATLTGSDGSQAFALTQLAGIKGLNCGDAAKRAAKTISAPQGLSGLWFDPAFDGSGFNLLHTPAGALLAVYYGYSNNGQPLWLISRNAVVEPLDFEVPVVFNMALGGSGTFNSPAPPSALVDWGTLTVQFNETCETATATASAILSGMDGNASLGLTQLAGIKGLSCR